MQVQTQQQNIIFQTTTNPAGQIPLQQLQFHPPPNMVEAQPNNVSANENDCVENNGNVKDEKSSPEPNDIHKSDDKNDGENNDGGDNVQTNISMQMPPPIRFTTTPIMAVPPPISCTQHIVGNTHVVGNTLITSTQSGGTHTHQIYNPVIQAAPPAQQHQIHVSSSGQHFLVNTQYPQQTFQQVPQNVQSFQLTAAPQAR